MTDSTTTAPETPLDTLEAAYLKQLDELDENRTFREAAEHFTEYFFHIEFNEDRTQANALIDLWNFKNDLDNDSAKHRLEFHSIDLYEDCYEWKFDDEFRQWNIEFKEQIVIQHAIALQEITLEQVFEKFKEGMRGFAARDLLLYARAVRHENLYVGLKGVAAVKKMDKLFDDVLALETPISMSFDELGEYAVLSETAKELKAYIMEKSSPSVEMVITR